jgi:hypothetical protein
MLAEHLRDQAARRSGKADEYDDARNTESGCHCSMWPSTSSSCRTTNRDWPASTLRTGSARWAAVSRILREYVIRTWSFHTGGYGGPPDRFMDDFVDAAERDAAAWTEEAAMAAEDNDDDE